MCSVLLFIVLAIGIGFTVARLLHLPPSFPSFTLHSVAPLPPFNENNDAATTLTPQNWQVSFYLHNTNVKPRHGAVSYDHVNAHLFLWSTDHEKVVVLSNDSSESFEQGSGQRSQLEVRFPGATTGTRECKPEEVIYSGMSPCSTVKLALRWDAKVRFHGTTRASRKEGSIEVVCEDVKVFVSPPDATAVIYGGDKECFVGGTWHSHLYVAKRAWILIFVAVLLCFILYCNCSMICSLGNVGL